MFDTRACLLACLSVDLLMVMVSSLCDVLGSALENVLAIDDSSIPRWEHVNVHIPQHLRLFTETHRAFCLGTFVVAYVSQLHIFVW